MRRVQFRDAKGLGWEREGFRLGMRRVRVGDEWFRLEMRRVQFRDAKGLGWE